MKSLLLLISMTFFALTSSFAGDLYLVTNVASYHFDRDVKRNEFNPGLGVEYVQNDLTFAAGGFRNSTWKNSLYATVAYTPIHLGNSVRVGALLGAINGYEYLNKGNFTPMAGLVLQYHGDRYGANVVLLPPGNQKSSTVVGVQLKVKF